MNAMKKMVEKWGWSGVTAAYAIFFSSFVARAQTLTDPLGGKESFTTVATAVAGFLFWDVASPLSVIMVLVGAFQLITSAGDPEKVSKGRKTIMYAAIGLVIALIAGGVVSIIQGFISGSSS